MAAVPDGAVDELRLETTYFDTAPLFRLDFNGRGTDTQAGYFAMGTEPENENLPFVDTAVFSDVFGPGEDIEIAFDGNRAKSRAALSGGPYQDLSNLLRDWYGKDGIDDFSLSLTLPHGTYRLTSLHHDAEASADRSIDVNLQDAIGTRTEAIVQTGGAAPESIGTFTGNVTSNGTDAITLTYASSGQIGINGLHLEPFGFWSSESGGLWSNADNWMHGHMAAGADTIASFRGVNILSDVTISLDSSRTLYGLAFGDLDPTSPAGWKIDSNGDPANTISLSGVPFTITVNDLGTGKTAEIAVAFTGDTARL